MTARNGSAEWHGDIQSGSGTITVGEHVFEGPFSYDSRFGAQTYIASAPVIAVDSRQFRFRQA